VGAGGAGGGADRGAHRGADRGTDHGDGGRDGAAQTVRDQTGEDVKGGDGAAIGIHVRRQHAQDLGDHDPGDGAHQYVVALSLAEGGILPW
jgi:hypothetical protein